MKRTTLTLCSFALLSAFATACASQAPETRGEDQIAKNPAGAVAPPSELEPATAPSPCSSSDLSAAQSHCNDNHAHWGDSTCQIGSCTVRGGYIVYSYSIYYF